MQDDYDAFAKQARLMTSIHAPIPPNLRDAVLEATRRGEEHNSVPQPEAIERPATSRAVSSTTSLVMKRKVVSKPEDSYRDSETRPPSSTQNVADASTDSEEGDDTKENDPSHSPIPVFGSYESTRKNILGKRPLAELPTPMDPDATDSENVVAICTMTDSNEKTSASQLRNTDSDQPSEPVRKSPKLDLLARNTTMYAQVPQKKCAGLAKEEDFSTGSAADLGDDKENIGDIQGISSTHSAKCATQQPAYQTSEQPPRPTLRKVSNVGSSRSKGQARIGIRRL